MKFTLRDTERVRTVFATIASDTEIDAGDLVALDTGLIIKAAAASTEVAYAIEASASGDTVIEVTKGNDFTLTGTADVVFAVSHKGGEYDINDTTQTIDIGASSTNVLKIGIGTDAGVVDSASDVTVKINKPIF